MTDQPAQANSNSQSDQTSVDSYVPPSSDTTNSIQSPSRFSQASSPAPSSSASSPVSQTLEEQNIFFLLGVTEASEDEKESFLDELQQVIWEDFLANDVELLVTEEEMEDLKKIMQKSEGSEEQKQEEIVIFLEKLIPDLEEIMLEKALELKEDMVRERITGMKEYFAGRDDKIQELDRASDLIDQGQWRDAAEALNGISD